MRFGSAHTDEKLKKLEDYLKSFSTALKNQDFRLIYFDAFAGAGKIQIAPDEATLLDAIDEYQPFIRGSTQRALHLGRAFDQYIFVDKKKKNVQALHALKDQHEDISARISVRHGDANEEIEKFCSETDWRKCRAVVFLDPYGNQVKWKTIEAIASTKAIDLWYLFPAFLGVYRQISASAGVHESHERSLDDLLGTKDWRHAFIEERAEEDLFGDRKMREKRATVDSITRYMLGRMKNVFGGGVLDEWLPLGSRKIHMYSLVFAWANPSDKARLAGKLAQAVLRSGQSGRTK
jgi:three-Cys-motif partner protein